MREPMSVVSEKAALVAVSRQVLDGEVAEQGLILRERESAVVVVLG